MSSSQIYRVTDVFDLTSKKFIIFGIGSPDGFLRPGMKVLLPSGAPASCDGRIVAVESRQYVDLRPCTLALVMVYQTPEDRAYLMQAFPIGGKIEVTPN